MQVDPNKPTSKPRGTTHFKLGYDEPPSNFAFKSDLRHYSKDEAVYDEDDDGADEDEEVGWCRLTLSNPR